jgi:hypothetical protein
MGGKALNRFGVQTERKGTEEFKQIGAELSIKVFHDLTLFTSIVKCYHTKADHGDLDLLIEVPIDTDIKWVDYIRKAFQPQAVNANGGVYSFDYKNFQVDFIPIPKLKWEIALIYFSYDPLGNIMGKTYHKFGLSYGWEGLYYKFRGFNGSLVKDILISTDIKKIFEFGGYDYERYLNGFETLEEIFKFCIAGKYFDAEMFQMENLKHIDRKRNRKRGSYHLFLNYLKDNGIYIKYKFEEDKNKYLSLINNCFPEAKLLEQLTELQLIDSKNKIISQKFNGDIVMSWLPNLKGKELGNTMFKFKNSLGNKYEDFILYSSYDEIYNYFMRIFNEKL